MLRFSDIRAQKHKFSNQRKKKDYEQRNCRTPSINI